MDTDILTQTLVYTVRQAIRNHDPDYGFNASTILAQHIAAAVVDSEWIKDLQEETVTKMADILEAYDTEDDHMASYLAEKLRNRFERETVV